MSLLFLFRSFILEVVIDWRSTSLFLLTICFKLAAFCLKNFLEYLCLLGSFCSVILLKICQRLK
jgi:hypothetical protein